MDTGQVMQGFYVVDTIILFIAFLAVVGFVANILRLMFPRRDAIMVPMAMIRLAGIFFPPLGVILGYMPNQTYRRTKW